jgi:hypothetical protein
MFDWTKLDNQKRPSLAQVAIMIDDLYFVQDYSIGAIVEFLAARYPKAEITASFVYGQLRRVKKIDWDMPIEKELPLTAFKTKLKFHNDKEAGKNEYKTDQRSI